MILRTTSTGVIVVFHPCGDMFFIQEVRTGSIHSIIVKPVVSIKNITKTVNNIYMVTGLIKASFGMVNIKQITSHHIKLVADCTVITENTAR
jgi:hypothetical protein